MVENLYFHSAEDGQGDLQNDLQEPAGIWISHIFGHINQSNPFTDLLEYNFAMFMWCRLYFHIKKHAEHSFPVLSFLSDTPYLGGQESPRAGTADIVRNCAKP